MGRMGGSAMKFTEVDVHQGRGEVGPLQREGAESSQAVWSGWPGAWSSAGVQCRGPGLFCCRCRGHSAWGCHGEGPGLPGANC